MVWSFRWECLMTAVGDGLPGDGQVKCSGQRADPALVFGHGLLL